MLIFLRVLFSIVTIAIAGYSLITGDYEYQAYMTLSLGLTMLVTGIHEYQNNKKVSGWLFILLFALFLYLSIHRLILF